MHSTANAQAKLRGGALAALAGACAASAAAAALAVPAPAAAAVSRQAAPKGDASAFEGTGMWIWQVGKSSGGSPDAIAARAKRYGITTVFVKAAHGGSYWRQFSPQFVSALKSRGLKVCAYQRLQGRGAVGEARQAARAVRSGADCFVIDAESELAGKHRHARTYIRSLRAQVGADYPVGFTSFPYVSLHRSVPYSVFLGPGGAQFNLPQMYWRAIGTSVSRVFARTYRENRGFKRPIYPLGQAYSRPPASQIRSFRRLAARYGAKGVSWWSWQSAGTGQFRAIAPR